MNWSSPETVAGFAASPPNATLMQFAGRERRGRDHVRVLDIGCGAARNAAPLALSGWDVVGTDNSLPMLAAAARRRDAHALTGRLHLAQASMTHLPVRDHAADLIIAHGIWNLARSGDEFRSAGIRACAASSIGTARSVPTTS